MKIWAKKEVNYMKHCAFFASRSFSPFDAFGEKVPDFVY